MKVYKIFVHPIGQMQAVKQGWSWPGCLFTTIWALVKKLWGVAAVLFGSGILVLILTGIAAEQKAFGFSLLLNGVYVIGAMIIVGSLGNRWREKNLRARGYEDQGTVWAQTPDEAVALWVKEREGSERYRYTSEGDSHEPVHDLPARR